MLKSELIKFGPHYWQLLDIIDGKALMITNEIIELNWYHSAFEVITWEKSEIRKYLNSDFYNSFDDTEKEYIETVENKNQNNQWFNTNGGVATEDKIFLLSIEEVCKYFGNSIDKLVNKSKQKWSIDDEYNELRKAKYKNDFHWWRLRSPGYYDKTSASISKDGKIYVRGNGVFGKPKDGGGIRPALWLNSDKIKNLSLKN